MSVDGGVSVDVGVCVNGFLCQWVGMYVWVGVLMGVCVGGSVCRWECVVAVQYQISTLCNYCLVSINQQI